jgi:hypothetical protein
MEEEKPDRKIRFGDVGRKGSERDLDIVELLGKAASSDTWLIFAPDGRMWDNVSVEELATILYHALLDKLGSTEMVTLLIASFAVHHKQNIGDTVDALIAKAKRAR